MALSDSVRGRFGPSQFVSCEGHFVQRSNIFWEILSSHSQLANFRHFVMIWEFDSCANAFILFFWGSLEKLTTSVIKERQTEIVRASFAKASSLCHQDGRGRTNTRRSGWTRGNGSTPGSQHDEHLFCSFFEWEGETSRRRQISDTYLFVELVRLWSHSKFVKITTPFGVRLWKSLFETFQGTFVCVSLEYEQGRVSCVIRADNVERFFWFCGALSPEIVVDGISWETSSLSKVKATLAHARVRKFCCFCLSVVRISSTCLCWKRIL